MISAEADGEYILSSRSPGSQFEIPAIRTGKEMKSGPTISRSIRQFWQRLVDLITALPKGPRPRPVRVIAKTRDRNPPPQRY
ncbi:hypothetical protein B5K03_31945 [Rhizobium phaseoli]|nr:hypothetical protein B5K03_31945 [Rhizobium phaseoli]